MVRASVDHIAEGKIALPGVESDERIAHKISIDLLHPGNSPRLNGADPQHIQLLASSDGPLPAILVHQGTMRVIDGAHRLQVALLKRQETIEVIFFDGTDDDAFVAAVQANNAHGLPLTLADRRAAAARVLTSHPHRSDRWIAAVAGLAVGTVGAIRARTRPNNSEITDRTGRDGRVRPVSSVNGRKLASKVITEQPEASLRDIARIANISPGTARDVRERMRRGDNPVPARQSESAARRLQAAHPHTQATTQRAASTRKPRDCQALLQNLNADPSLRYSEAGRVLLRWLHTMAEGSSKSHDILEALPPHCLYPVAQVLRQCAGQWLKIADQLDTRSRSISQLARNCPNWTVAHLPTKHLTYDTPEKAR
jgi:hypothetical protein